MSLKPPPLPSTPRDQSQAHAAELTYRPACSGSAGTIIGEQTRREASAHRRCAARYASAASWEAVLGRMLSDSHDSWLCMTAADGVRAVVPFSVHARVVGGIGTFRSMVRCVRCMIWKSRECARRACFNSLP